MDWEVKKRGRVTYYRKKTNDVFSDLVVEMLDNGDLKIRFVGMTGALAATNELGTRRSSACMDPEKEIPRIFDTWEMYVREAGICNSLAELDFLEIHSFGAAPKKPHPLVEPGRLHGREGTYPPSLRAGLHGLLEGEDAGKRTACTVHSLSGGTAGYSRQLRVRGCGALSKISKVSRINLPS